MTRSLSADEVSEVKRGVARWIEELTVSRCRLPESTISELLLQLTMAPVLVDREGEHFLELPGLATLGLGIFQRTFLLSGRTICVAPYLPVNVALTPCCPQAAVGDSGASRRGR